MAAEDESPRASEGRMTLRSHSQGASVMGVKPVAGNQRRFTAKTSTSSIAPAGASARKPIATRAAVRRPPTEVG